MTIQTIHLPLPFPIYQRAQQRAAQRQRSIEDELASEQQEMQQLQQLAHRVMLLRAEAAVLLKQRGQDITSLRQSQRAT